MVQIPVFCVTLALSPPAFGGFSLSTSASSHSPKTCILVGQSKSGLPFTVLEIYPPAGFTALPAPLVGDYLDQVRHLLKLTRN